ncbi:hypothetical protein PJWF_00078 [Achromobacter phage JWF]|uniref:hypothetical protein n=1 Tax=Achromobacter phage JWF TaxID=1589748 RepID=UPI000588E385|nr:hypothetical protein AXJ13_gp110 [Achromobacter phage JWF]AJD82971.1 hypothetical protein PJWF_00078 [Achromobacter phage JWF]
MTKTTKTKRYTMLDMMIAVQTGPSVYHIVQNGHMEYAGTDWRRAGAQMAWLRIYRWGEVCFFKDGKLTETLRAPEYQEPPPPSEAVEIQVTAAMVKALREVIDDHRRPGSRLQVLKEGLQAALRAYYDNKGNGSS